MFQNAFPTDFDDWVEEYKPILNKYGLPRMFETYGEDWEFVKKQNSYNVWTECETDGYTMIYAGFHRVNRTGYYVTEIPAEKDSGIWLETDRPDDPEEE